MLAAAVRSAVLFEQRHRVLLLRNRLLEEQGQFVSLLRASWKYTQSRLSHLHQQSESAKRLRHDN